MRRTYIILNLIVVSLFIVDRAVKLWFQAHPGVSQDIFVGLLSFNYVTNSGIAFGLPLPAIILWLLLAVIFILLVYTLTKAYQERDQLAIFSLSLILVGAVSNIIDRIRFGFVIDYINVPFFTVFNLADSMITVGVVLLIAPTLFNKTRQKPTDHVN